MLRESTTHENVHLRKHVIGSNEVMSDPHPVRFHGMAKAIGIRTNVR